METTTHQQMTLTIRATESESIMIHKIKDAMNVNSASKALIAAGLEYLKMVEEIKQLKTDKRRLQEKVLSYSTACSNILDGLSQIKELHK